MARSKLFEDAIDIRDKKRRLAETIIRPWGYIYTDPNAPEPEPIQEMVQEAIVEQVASESDPPTCEVVVPNASDYNASTGSYSGAYGKGPIDESTRSMAADILATRKNEVDEIMKMMEAAKNNEN